MKKLFILGALLFAAMPCRAQQPAAPVKTSSATPAAAAAPSVPAAVERVFDYNGGWSAAEGADTARRNAQARMDEIAARLESAGAKITGKEIYKQAEMLFSFRLRYTGNVSVEKEYRKGFKNGKQAGYAMNRRLAQLKKSGCAILSYAMTMDNDYSIQYAKPGGPAPSAKAPKISHANKKRRAHRAAHAAAKRL